MKVFVIGLDCAEPSLIFERFADELPHLTRLREEGIWGRIKSIIPPITVPAWMSMMTGLTPGQLGIYGFRNRKDRSYTNLSIVTSRWVKRKAVWDVLSEAGYRSVVVGVPPSYPPKPLNGLQISCFLTPGPDSPFTYPPALKEEIQDRFGPYRFDVVRFRTEDKDRLARDVFELTRQRFAVVRYLMTHKPWDFFVFVDMGPDRFHHGFWKFFDPQHRKYVPGNPYESLALEYYRLLDREVGEVLKLLPSDTHLFVVSDHGAKRMDGGIAINEWLIRKGYLRLKKVPEKPRPLRPEDVDWKRTLAWGEGGYYGRLFLNVRGREPEGVLDPGEVEAFRDHLIRELEALGDEEGNPIGTRVYKPEAIYPEVRNIAPDLIVIFGDLYWRSAGSIGLSTLWVHENDTGPDDANHAQLGTFIYRGPLVPQELAGQQVEGLHILDIGPTILHLFELPSAPDTVGRNLFEQLTEKEGTH